MWKGYGQWQAYLLPNLYYGKNRKRGRCTKKSWWCCGYCYKEAVTFQEAGDYSSALTIYDSLGDYKDSVDRGSECQSYITAIDSYNSAKDAAKALNESLDTEVTKAEQLVTSEDLALDGACQLKCVSFLFPLVFKGCSVDGADRYSGHF